MKNTLLIFSKPKLLILLFVCCAAMPAMAQVANLNGTWVTSKDIKIPDEHTSGVVTISTKATTWNIFNNQFFLDFSNKVKKDTLLLLYKSCDCAKPFKTSNIKFPKGNTVFAKCYRISEKELGIIYLNRAFITSVKKYVTGTKAEKEMIFPPVLYLNNNKAVHPVRLMEAQ